mgnify:CR=1 FL=1
MPPGTTGVVTLSVLACTFGTRGELLKRISTAARKDMERLFGGKVFLETRVKVKKGWADDAAMLGRLGYSA